MSDRQRWALGGLALVVVIAAAALILPGVFDAKRDNDAKVAREHAARVAAEKKRLTREQRPLRGRPAGLRAARPDRQRDRAARRAPQARARARGRDPRRRALRVAAGELDGPIKRVSCGPLIKNPGKHTEDEDLSKTRGRYDCVAVKREVMNGGKVVGLLGHPFVGTADFKRFTYVWCKDNKVPGERGKPLAKVPIPAVCIGAEGRPASATGIFPNRPENVHMRQVRCAFNGVLTARGGAGSSPGKERTAWISRWGSPSRAWLPTLSASR